MKAIYEAMEMLRIVRSAIECAGPETLHFIKIPLFKDTLDEDGLVVHDQHGREWIITAKLVQKEDPCVCEEGYTCSSCSRSLRDE